MAPLPPHRRRRHHRVDHLAVPGGAVDDHQAGRQRLPHHHLGRRALASARTRTSSSAACAPGWRRTRPRSIIVLDVADTEVIDRLEARRDRRLRVMPFKHQGKRSALGRRHPGGHAARSRAGRLRHLLDCRAARRRADALRRPEVGGVGTQQNVYEHQTQHLAPASPTGWSTPLLRLRARQGPQVAPSSACPGRTAAYRRVAVMPVLANLEDEFFLGRRCVAGDDGRLTWLVLAQGTRRCTSLGAGAVDVPGQLQGLRQAAGPVEPQLLPLLSHRDLEGLAVEAAAGRADHRAADPADAGDDGLRHVYYLLCGSWDRDALGPSFSASAGCSPAGPSAVVAPAPPPGGSCCCL